MGLREASDVCVFGVFFFQAEDGIRDLVRSRGLGDVYKRQGFEWQRIDLFARRNRRIEKFDRIEFGFQQTDCSACLLYTSDAADERSSVDLGGRRIIKKKIKS